MAFPLGIHDIYLLLSGSLIIFHNLTTNAGRLFGTEEAIFFFDGFLKAVNDFVSLSAVF